MDDLEGVTVLGINPPTLARSSRLMKRGMDVAVAFTVLLLALPVMLVAAVAIKLTSPGPILFTQERVGRRGRRFRIYKFRTMCKDAEERAADLREASAHSAWLLLEDDPRITRVGRILRPTSLDELPQLWNVLEGDMSLVGPRPMPPGGGSAHRRVGQAPPGPDAGRSPASGRCLAGPASRSRRWSTSTTSTSPTGRCGRTSGS